MATSSTPSHTTDTGSPIDIESISQEEVTRIPDDVEALLLLPSNTIQSLLHVEGLPSCIDLPEGDLPPPASCITNHEVHWSPSELLGSPIPPRGWLGSLWVELQRRLQSEHHPISLQDPTTPSLYLPLWGVNMWLVALGVIKQQCLWADAMKWLSDRGQGTEAVMALIGEVPWG